MKTIGIVKLVFMLIEAYNPCLHVSVCVCLCVFTDVESGFGFS